MGGHHTGILTDKKVRRGELAAVCDVNTDFLARYEGIGQFTDFGKMCRSGLIDAVIIATPHYAHTPLTIQAFKNGLHVLSEKPLAVHKADAEKMLKACPRGKKFAAMLQCRVSPLYRKVKEIVDGGKLGRIMRVNMIATDWFRTNAYYAGGGWRASWKGEGGGVLINQCPHDLDLLQWICGMPTRIQATCGFGKWHKLEVEDDVSAILEFPNGATGTFIASTGEAPGCRRLEIVGEGGQLLVENGQLRFIQNKVSALKFIKTSKQTFAKPESREVKVPVAKIDKAHVGIIQNFIDAILDGVPLIAPASEAIHQVELTNAIIQAGVTGEAVDLPLNSRSYKRLLDDLASGKIVAGK
jgi:predicted dehydrogenase